jgi:hypothetical protein
MIHTIHVEDERYDDIPFGINVRLLSIQHTISCSGCCNNRDVVKICSGCHNNVVRVSTYVRDTNARTKCVYICGYSIPSTYLRSPIACLMYCRYILYRNVQLRPYVQRSLVWNGVDVSGNRAKKL